MNIFLSVKILVEMKNEGLAKTKCEMKKLNPHVGNNPRLTLSLTFMTIFTIRESRSQVDLSTWTFNRLHFERLHQFLTSSNACTVGLRDAKFVTAALCLTFF